MDGWMDWMVGGREVKSFIFPSCVIQRKSRRDGRLLATFVRLAMRGGRREEGYLGRACMGL